MIILQIILKCGRSPTPEAIICLSFPFVRLLFKHQFVQSCSKVHAWLSVCHRFLSDDQWQYIRIRTVACQPAPLKGMVTEAHWNNLIRCWQWIRIQQKTSLFNGVWIMWGLVMSIKKEEQETLTIDQGQCIYDREWMLMCKGDMPYESYSTSICEV